MLVFIWPWMAVLLLLPIISWLLLPGNNKNNNENLPEILFPYTDRLQTAFDKGQKIKQSKSKFWLVATLSLLWLFLVLTVMRPELVDRSTYINRQGYDIMLAVDISPSMNAPDMSTKDKKASRLEAVKEVVSNFIETRKGDRLGLILFGEYAYLQAPMTLDNFAISKMLNNALPGMAGLSTAIGDAIGISIRELRNRSSKSKVVILLTDGTDTSSNLPPIDAAQIAEKYGIRVYTIGVGSDNAISYYDQMGNVTSVEAAINEELLQKIANITGGQYFRAKDDYSLEKIYSKINELEKIDLTAREYRSESLHKYPLGIACVLFLILCLMPLYNRYRYGI